MNVPKIQEEKIIKEIRIFLKKIHKNQDRNNTSKKKIQEIKIEGTKYTKEFENSDVLSEDEIFHRIFRNY
jgi:ribosomal protein L3